MEPHELIDRLVKGSGKSALQIATEMRGATFQGTLHKFMSGNVRNPQRATAEVVARYFNLPTDALYDAKLATKIARERGLLPTDAARPGAVEEPRPAYVVTPIPTRPRRHDFSAATQRRIQTLDAQQHKALEAVVIAFLDATTKKRNGRPGSTSGRGPAA